MFHEIPFSGYLVMASDGRKDGRKDRHGQNYIHPPLAGDKKGMTLHTGQEAKYWPVNTVEHQ